MKEFDFTPLTMRLDQALKKQRMQKKILAAAIGVPQTTLNTWINRGGDFPASYIIPICRALDIQPLWLLTGEGGEALKSEIPETFVELSADEKFLLDTYRSLDRAGQIVIANAAVEEMRRSKTELSG